MGFDLKKWFTDDPEGEVNEPSRNVSNNRPVRQGTAASQAVLVQPRAFSESQQIADHLKNNRPVIINMKRLTADQAKRVVDFLSGTLYAIDGVITKVGSGIFLCTPSSMAVQGSIEEYGSKEKKDDDIELDF